MNAVKVTSIYTHRSTRGNHVYFILRVDFQLADGRKQAFRRHYPTLEIANLVKAELSGRREYLIECFNHGVEWERSAEVNNAYRDWIRTLSIDERLAFAKQRHSPSAELDPEIITIIQQRTAKLPRTHVARQRALRERTTDNRPRHLNGGDTQTAGVSISAYTSRKMFFLEVTVTSAGHRKRQRRCYPNMEIAHWAKADLCDRQEYLADCFNRGVAWQDSQDVQDAVNDLRSSQQQTSRDEVSARKSELIRKRSKERAKRREQISALRQRSTRKQTRDRTQEEIQAATERGMAAKARFEERQRERKLAAIEHQTEIQQSKQLEAARKHQLRLQQRAELSRKRALEAQQKLEIKRQILELARVERSKRLQNEADRRAGKLVFDGADILLTFCKIGVLTDEQAQMLVRVDVDPDIVIRSLKRIASMPIDERQSAVAHMVEKFQDNFGNIPEREHITRWSIRAASELCRKETQELTTDDISQSLFFSLENDDDDPAWLDGDSGLEIANGNVSGQSITEKKVPSTGVAA